MEMFKLNRPVFINGEEKSELPYDFDAMTAGDKLRVLSEMSRNSVALSTVEEGDVNYHFYLFARAVEIASKNEISADDLTRISARDAARAGRMARDFFYSA